MADSVISVLIPTRDRPQPLEASIRVLHHLAAQPERLEILLRVDDDDPVDYEETIWPLFTPRGAPRIGGRVLRGPQHGYRNLHRYFNELAAFATGRWCMLWSDDAFVATPRWDTVLDGIDGHLLVACPESNHGRSPCTFPIFTKSFADILGHVSLNCHTDTWIEEVGEAAGIRVPVEILVLHAYFPEHLDQKSSETSAEFGGAAMCAARTRDAETLKKVLDRTRTHVHHPA